MDWRNIMKKHHLIQILLLCYINTVIYAENLITFKAGTPAKASEVNTNFSYLQNSIVTPLVILNNIKIGYYISKNEVDKALPTNSVKVYNVS